jgi:hypothetical protein
LGQQITPLSTLPPVDVNGEIKLEPEQIIEHRIIRRNKRSLIEVLIKWKGVPSEENTWENYWKLCELYPHLVGKVL